MSPTPVAGPVSELRSRGWAVLPAPRRVEFQSGIARITPEWAVQTDNVSPDDISVRLLAADHGLRPRTTGKPPGLVRLAVRKGAIMTGSEPACDEQAYRLSITPEIVEVTGNSPAGLFHGVQTLWQLLDAGPAGPGGLPANLITDWPRYPLRIAHWCTNGHQDRIETLKRYIDWTARFKLNAISFDLEDRFAYPSHPVIGVPDAFTPEQMRELTAYGLERHIQIIPNVQAPAHMSYVLKHEEFAGLRCDGSNYMACMDDPAARKLIFDMYQDMIDATPGVDYFHVSVDELYYAGICEKFRKPYNAVNRSLTYVDFVNAAHGFLAERGRKALIWGEFPLLTEHVHLLAPGLIDAIVGGDESFVLAENARGIRQLIYQPILGEEHHMPSYFGWQDLSGARREGRLEQGLEACSPRGKTAKGNPLGVFAAAWDNSGPHNEVFWLGWATLAQFGWNGDAVTVEQTAADFMDIYYGGGHDLVEIYRELQQTARFCEATWDRVPTKVRPPAYGNSKGKRPTQRRDMTLIPPDLPELPDLTLGERFHARYATILAQVPQRLAENDRILGRLAANFTRVRRNRYNLQVLTALASLHRHHLHMLAGLVETENLLEQASAAHRDGKPTAALKALDAAGAKVGRINADLYATYERVKAVWEVSMLPRNGSTATRQHVPYNDDVKDYFAHRRSDLTYLIAPEESIGLKNWHAQLAERASAYARAHGLASAGSDQPLAEE